MNMMHSGNINVMLSLPFLLHDVNFKDDMLIDESYKDTIFDFFSPFAEHIYKNR